MQPSEPAGEGDMTELPPLDTAVLPEGVGARFVDGVNGLRMHILEAGYDTPGRPLLLLLHGFPELAYSWRKIIVPLAEAGFHVVAPDQRGYGRTTGWDPDYDGDLASFRMLNLARDALGLVAALGHTATAAVIGHDFGASVAAWCALVRPDVFRSLVLMAPFAGPPALPETGAAPTRWLPEDELAVYSGEYERTGFQGGLQWYRCRTGGVLSPELELFAGRAIDVPSLFIGGNSDWGTYQTPGAFERMQTRAVCTD